MPVSTNTDLLLEKKNANNELHLNKINDICSCNLNLCQRNSSLNKAVYIENNTFETNLIRRQNFKALSFLNFDSFFLNNLNQESAIYSQQNSFNIIQRKVNKRSTKRGSLNIGQHLFIDTSKNSLTNFDLILLDAYHDNIIYNANFDNKSINNKFSNNQSQHFINKVSIEKHKEDTLNKCVTFLEPNLIDKTEFYHMNQKNSIDSGYFNETDDNLTLPYCFFANDLVSYNKDEVDKCKIKNKLTNAELIIKHKMNNDKIL